MTALITRIETCTKFSLPAQKRDLAFSYAASRLRKTKQAYAEAKSQGKPVSTSRRDFLATIQDTIFLGIPVENVALMPISEYVLNDPTYYEAAMFRAASLTEDELFMALSPIFKDMTVQDARDFVSKLWHDGIDDNARKYAEALKRPERERQTSQPDHKIRQHMGSFSTLATSTSAARAASSLSPMCEFGFLVACARSVENAASA